MKKIYSLSLLTSLLVFASCESILEIDPRQSIDSSQALKTPEGITANLANIYSNLKSTLLYGRDFVATAEALADNARIINRAGGRYVQQGANAPNNHFGNWATAYNVINQINILLEALPSASVTDSFRDSVEGQIRALRALFYFDLMRAYAYEPGMAPAPSVDFGGVPLFLTGVLDPSQIELKSRATQAEVYNQMYADLNVAITKAPTTGGPTYVTRAFAFALYAKVALYNRDFDNAESYATQALALKGNLSTNASYVADWRQRVHPESLFEVTFTTDSETIGVNESVQSAFTTRIALPPSTTLGGWGAVVPTSAYLALFPVGDVRRTLYENGLNRSGSVVIECTKFLGKTGTVYMDNIPVMRTSELHLIRAEARLRKAAPDENGARADVNVIAQRAGLAPYDVTVVGAALLNAIYLQRQLELGWEGDRWFDMKRRGQGFTKSTGNVPYDDYRILAPIPVREIQSNPNLKQNANY